MTVEGTSSSLAQTTGEVAVVSVAASKSATRPVKGPGTGVLAGTVPQTDFTRDEIADQELSEEASVADVLV